MADVLKAITKLESKVQGVKQQLQDDLRGNMDKYLTEREPLVQRRYELVTGKSQPTPQELQGFQAVGRDAGKGEQPRGVPGFWLTALCADSVLQSHITERDRLALEYLEDVRWLGRQGMAVELVFSPDNPYFSNRLLRRGVYVQRNLDAADEEPGVAVQEGHTEIDWSPGHNLTLKEVTRKKKKSKKGKGKAAVAEDEDGAPGPKRFKPCPSFFRFFMPSQPTAHQMHDYDPAADPAQQEEEEVEGEDEDGAEEAKCQADSEILEALLQRVVPSAVRLYLEGLEAGRSVSTSAVVGSSGEDEEGFEMVSGSGMGQPPPLSVQKAVHALKAVQQGLDDLMDEVRNFEVDSRSMAQAKITQLYAERRALLINEDGEMALPGFWLRGLRALEITTSFIQKRDEKLLERLVDVRWIADPIDPQDTSGMYRATLELEFLPNPFLKHNILRKHYTFGSPILDGGSGLPEVPLSADPEPVQWQDGQDPTVKLGPNGKSQQLASFFCLFKPGAARHTFHIMGDDRESRQEAMELEAELLAELRLRLLPTSASLCSNSNVGRHDEEEEEEEESDEDEEGADGKQLTPAERTAKQRAEKKKKAKGGFKIDATTVLVVVVVAMILAQVVAFFDEASFWKKVL